MTQGPALTAQQRARLDAMTDQEITRRAEADADNPPLTDEEFLRIEGIRAVRAARRRTKLSRPEFARRYRIDPARLRDWEQGRHPPDSATLAYLRVIAREPEAVDRALAE